MCKEAQNHANNNWNIKYEILSIVIETKTTSAVSETT